MKKNYFCLVVAQLTLLLAIPASSDADDLLVSHREAETSIILSRLSTTVRALYVRAPKIKRVRAFILSEPKRIVIDVHGAVAGGNKAFSVSDSIIQGVRIGRHPDRLRVVLDIADHAEIPAFSMDKRRGTAILRLEDGNSWLDLESRSPITTAATPTPTTPSSPSTISEQEKHLLHDFFKLLDGSDEHTPSSTPSPSPTTISIPTEPIPIELIPTEPIPTEPLPTATHTPAALPTADKVKRPDVEDAATPTTIVQQETLPPSSPIATIADGRQGLSDIQFGYNDNQLPVLKLMLNNRPSFRLARRNNQLYSITIDNSVVITDHLKLVRFPPQDFAGFTHVQARELADKIEILIGVERNTRIRGLPNGNEIWIQRVE